MPVTSALQGIPAVRLTLTMLVALAFLLPSLMGLQRYVIMGGSMEGTYDLGSVVLSEVVPVSELEVGDVITYVPPAESGITTLVTHRIVSIDGEDLRTQGDANPAVDPWTFQLTAATQPRVVAHVPYAGYVFMALADRGTRMALIGLPAALIALWSLVELGRALRPERPVEPAVAATPATSAEPRTPALV
jgi:signal peptidase